MDNDRGVIETARSADRSDGGLWPPSLLGLLIGGIAGALLGWLAITKLYPIFTIPPEIAILPDPPPMAAIEKLEIAQFQVDSKNFSVLFAIVGLTLGVCYSLGAFGLRKRNSLVSSGILASIFCLAGALLCNLMVTKTRSVGGNDIVMLGLTLDIMKQAMLAQAALWGLTGLGIGIGIAVPSVGRSFKSGLGGMLGGFAAALLYAPILAVVRPMTGNDHVIPLVAGEQIAWLGCATLLIAAGIALGSGERRRKG